MQISSTQLQAYNAMFKLLDDYYESTKSDDIGGLASTMCFLIGGSTADPAIWGDWEEAINHKKKLTAQEAFGGMIKFLEEYGNRVSSLDALLIVEKLRSAKNCSDTTIHLVKQWNLFLKESLSEPEGTREYLQLIK